MSHENLLRQAADIARADTDARWHPVADWLAAIDRAIPVFRAALVEPGWDDGTDPEQYRHPIAIARALTGEGE